MKERERTHEQTKPISRFLPNKDKLKFHYFKNIFYLYFVKTYLTSSEYNLKAIQNVLLTTYKIYKDKLGTHEKTHFEKHITFINTFKDKAKKKKLFLSA